MEKFLEDHSKSILVTLMQEHKKLLKRLDELRSTSKEKHGGIGVKISNLEVSEEEAVIVEDGVCFFSSFALLSFSFSTIP